MFFVFLSDAIDGIDFSMRFTIYLVIAFSDYSILTDHNGANMRIGSYRLSAQAGQFITP
jgi:hypothetical protein